jgi:hypothetical protein
MVRIIYCEVSGRGCHVVELGETPFQDLRGPRFFEETGENALDEGDNRSNPEHPSPDMVSTMLINMENEQTSQSLR